MSEDEAPGRELEALSPVQVGRAELMSDDEIRRMYRIAESLALSGMWKDIKKAEAAFAKMVIGRDLGMSPAAAMQGIHFVDGGIQMHYSTLGQFIRAREGYDFRAGWIKEQPRIKLLKAEPEGPPEQVFVWHDEEDPLDDRPVVGAAVVLTVDGVQRGVSRYTVEDAKTAGLIKTDARAAWNTSRRNMLLARAMSNGVKWFVPEVMGGLPVYVAGELVGQGSRPSLTDGTSDSDDAPLVELGPQVEKVIERAEKLGHRGLANRAAVALAVGNRAPGVVKAWCAQAHKELSAMEAERRAAETVDGEAVEVPPAPSNAVSPNPDQLVEQDAPTNRENEQQAAVLRTRLTRLNAIDPVALVDEDATQLQEEIEMVEQKLRDLGVEVS